MKQKKIKVKKEKLPNIDYKNQAWRNMSKCNEIPFRMLHKTHLRCKMDFGITSQFFWLCMN